LWDSRFRTQAKKASSDCAAGAEITTGAGAVVVVVCTGRGTVVATGATVVAEVAMSVATTTTVVVVVSSVEGTAATTRLESDELADSVALLVGELWSMSITSNGKHASVTMRAIISRRCVGCTVVFRTASFVEQ
jgi:hypothetical protein